MEDIENIEHLDEVEELQTHVAEAGKICKSERVTSRQSTGSTMLPGETAGQITTTLVMPCVLNATPTSELRPELADILPAAPKTHRISLAGKTQRISVLSDKPSRSSTLSERPKRDTKKIKLPEDQGTDNVQRNDNVQRTASQKNADARRSFLTQDNIQQLQQMAATQEKAWGMTMSTGGIRGHVAGEVLQRRLLLWLFLEEPWESLRSIILSCVILTIMTCWAG